MDERASNGGQKTATTFNNSQTKNRENQHQSNLNKTISPNGKSSKFPKNSNKIFSPYKSKAGHSNLPSNYNSQGVYQGRIHSNTEEIARSQKDQFLPYQTLNTHPNSNSTMFNENALLPPNLQPMLAQLPQEGFSLAKSAIPQEKQFTCNNGQNVNITYSGAPENNIILPLLNNPEVLQQQQLINTSLNTPGQFVQNLNAENHSSEKIDSFETVPPPQKSSSETYKIHNQGLSNSDSTTVESSIHRIGISVIAPLVTTSHERYIPPEERNRIHDEREASATKECSVTKECSDVVHANKTLQLSVPETPDTSHLNNATIPTRTVNVNTNSRASEQEASNNTEIPDVNTGVNNPQPTFSEKLRGNLCSTPRTRKIIRMKVIPPFRKEHFMYSQLLEDDVQKAINEIASIFQPKHRGLITISRTNIPQQNGRRLQILMVTAPGEAEEEVARAKLNGIKIMGKTVFPTGDEFWRFSPGEFPKKAMIHITNLPVLCETDELEEMLGLPDHTEHDIMQRESIQTDSGKIYTGRARIPIVINSKEHEEHLLEWSNWRNSEDGLLVWNEIPVYMSIPKLHKCGECEKEGRPYIGHDEKWCRIRRPQQIPTVDHQEPDPIQSHSVQEEDTIPEQEVSNPPQQNEDIHVPMNTENFIAEEVKDSSDDENQPTSSEDDRVDENLDGNAEEPNKWQQTNHNKKRKRKKKSKTSNDSMSSSTKQPNKKPWNVSNG